MPSISPNEEKELLSQLRQGSEPAFEKIYKLYSTRLYGNILKFTKSEPEAQEILQDTFLKIWNERQHIDPEKSFRSFLFKIAENKVYDFFRKAVRDRKKEEALIAKASEEYIPEDLLLSEENTTALQQAIATLPPQRQQVFRLCKLEGKSYKEVSELLGISTSTISDHIVKATKTIREYFETHGQGLLALFAIASFSFMG